MDMGGGWLWHHGPRHVQEEFGWVGANNVCGARGGLVSKGSPFKGCSLAGVAGVITGAGAESRQGRRGGAGGLIWVCQLGSWVGQAAMYVFKAGGPV